MHLLVGCTKYKALDASVTVKSNSVSKFSFQYFIRLPETTRNCPYLSMLQGDAGSDSP